MNDTPLQFHNSFNELLDSFRNIVASATWLKASIPSAKKFYDSYPYIIELSCSAPPGVSIKVDKSILTLVEREGFGNAPLFSNTLVNFYRMFTIAVKDIIWEEQDFVMLKGSNHLKFLKHLRNACAHNNEFYWGSGRARKNTLKELPLVWRGKVIKEDIEGKTLYFDFLSPGDIFFLLSDISSLATLKS